MHVSDVVLNTLNAMTKQLVITASNLLEKLFLVGEADKTRRYTVETMLEELDVMTEGQVDKNEVPKL
nr:9137_t:CDS:2 [Entrophospora candida]